MPPSQEDPSDLPPELDLPTKFNARIVGQVQYRSGDGPLQDLPQGQDVAVEVALGSMVLSWTEEGQPLTVTLARPEFLQYVDTGDIRIHT